VGISNCHRRGVARVPYRTNRELPDNVKGALPSEAQTVWRTAFNSAVGQGKSEEDAFKIAWGAVKRGWKKNEQGSWVKKELTKNARLILKDAVRRYTLGVVYEPDVADADGDFTDEAEIEKACWSFNKMLQGKTSINKTALQLLDAVVKALQDGVEVRVDVTDLMQQVEKGGVGLGFAHAIWTDDIGDIVESYIAPTDMQLGDQYVSKGTWLMGVQWSEAYFQKVLNGEITGYSLGGYGVRVPVEGGDSSAGEA